MIHEKNSGRPPLPAVRIRHDGTGAHTQHRPYIDQRRFHYGFLFGVHMQDLELKNNGYVDPETGEQW